MKKTFIIFISIALLAGSLAFGLNFIKPARAIVTHDPSMVTSIYPTSGPVGTVVTIYGNGFNTNQGNCRSCNIYVYFGAGAAGNVSEDIVSWTDEKIKVKVPSGATTAPIRVLNNFTEYCVDPITCENIVWVDVDVTGPTFTVTEAEDLTTKDLSFFAFDRNQRTGVNVAVGDLDGDGAEDIVVAAGQGSEPMVKIFDGQEHQILTDGFYAYSQNFRGGVNIAVGDVDGDGYNEIITGAGKGGGPHVRIFDRYGNVKYSGFFAYDKNFRGGVNVACGDVNGDGIDDIITGAGLGGGPHVRAFDKNGNAIRW